MVLRLSSITKTYPGAAVATPVLKGVDLTLNAGDTLALTGESGSGKSTLLHIAAGLETADQGEVHVDGHNLSQLDDTGRAALRRGTIGVVFQQFNLIPSLNVARNIAFQARLSDKEDREYTAHLCEKLGLTAQLDKYPEALSGGQQQRVAIARALVARPKLLLADEPTGNLDEGTAAEVLTSMLALVKDSHAALMMVTHSESVAQHMARRQHLSGGHLS